MKRIARTTVGAALIEYAILIALILLMAIFAVLTLGHKVHDIFDTVSSALSSNMSSNLASEQSEDEGEDEGDGEDEGEEEAESVCTGNCTYVGLKNGEISQLGDDGGIVWTYTHPGGGNIPALTVGPDGFIYAGAQDGTMMKLDADGNLIWSNDTLISSVIYKVAVSKDGDVYFGDDSPSVRKVDPATGTLQQRKALNVTMQTGAAPRDMVTDEAGNLYLAMAHGDFMKYTSDLTLLWQANSAFDYLDGIAVDLDGMLYIAGMNWDIDADDYYSDEMAVQYFQNGNVLERRNTFLTSGQVNGLDLGPNGEIAISSRNFMTGVDSLIAYDPDRWPDFYEKHPDWDYYDRWENTDVGSVVNDIEYDRNGFIWVANGDKTLRKIDQESGTEVEQYVFPAGLGAVAHAPGRFGTGY